VALYLVNYLGLGRIKEYYIMIKLLLFFKKVIGFLENYLRIIAFRSKYKNIPYSKYPFFYKNLLRANSLREQGVQFAEKDNRLIASFTANNQNLKLIIHSGNDLGLIDLVFIHRNYNFILHHPINVIDVGMNIGDTCLFFASNKFVDKVYGYELFEPTYNIALKNFEVNSSISNKIVPHCYGLGAKSEIIQIPYHTDYLGANGIFENAGKHLFKSKGEKLDCKIQNISQELNEIDSKLPLLLKLDVEGSEYGIIRELDKSKSFQNIKYIMMEYHFGYQDLMEILIRNGFEINEVFSSKNDQINLGLIYAVKQQI